MRTQSANQTLSTDPKGLGNPQGLPTGVQLRQLARTPLGREKVKLQWQVAPVGTPFTSTVSGSVISGTSSSWTDVLPGGTVITQNVTGLTQTTAYHWRARLVYRPGNPLGQAASRWIHMPWNGWNESDFRAATVAGGELTFTSRVITYTYDALNRLTGAQYFTGEFYKYQYDAVGTIARR